VDCVVTHEALGSAGSLLGIVYEYKHWPRTELYGLGLGGKDSIAGKEEEEEGGQASEHFENHFVIESL